ncbi:hypothetical protein MKX03_000912 [Papaver bracteatum]|nr:hypothetical protein MKX03_000912 [Papaver bracteatum]
MTREEEIENDMMMIDGKEAFNPDHLKIYYAKHFPYADISKWMSYGNDRKHPACDLSYFGRREFSFILGNDVYLRYQSFNNAAQMESSIRRECPFKIDIGAVYNVDPAKRNAYTGENAFTPVEKELVFDIDMSDYDDVRYCCSGANICKKCWALMTIAIKVIDSALREDFGFTHILWVYSGRRGVHCWVCDARARRLNNAQRAAIADYFHVYKGNGNSRKKVFLGGPVLHPSLVRSYQQVLRPFFEEELLCGQNLLETEEKFVKILGMIPDEYVNGVRWEKLKNHLQSGKQKWLRRCVEEIVFSYTYPRLDMGVTKLTNHLLKAPFCVHPKTGRVCVPIDPNRCEKFDPMAVPTLSTLHSKKQKVKCPNLDFATLQLMGGDRANELGGTSLDESVRFFRSSFLNPLLKSCKEEMEISHNAKLQQSKSSLNWYCFGRGYQIDRCILYLYTDSDNNGYFHYCE